MNILYIFYKTRLALVILFSLNLLVLHNQALASDEVKLTTKENLDEASEYLDNINKFWQINTQGTQTQNFCNKVQMQDRSSGVFCSTGKIKDFNGETRKVPDADINIHYIKILNDPDVEKGAIVISTGRTETYLKYKEVAYDLWNNGYSVYIIDHRGQGMSDREVGLDNPQKGHVEDFWLFVSDFRQFVDEVVKKGNHKNLFLIAHSMGGAIASLYLEQEGKETPFKAVAFTSPMHMIQSVVHGEKTTFITCPAAQILASLSGKGFTFSGKSYNEKHTQMYHQQDEKQKNDQFDKNEYTTEPVRYKRMVKEYDNNPQVRLGDPTHRWLAGACNAAKDAINNAKKISIPVQLYQARLDSIVHKDGHIDFCKNLDPKYNPDGCGDKQGGPIVIDGAKHELMIEKDEYRKKVLEGILEFFKKKG